MDIQTFQGGTPGGRTQSGTGSFLAAPPAHSTWAEDIAASIGHGLGKGLATPGPTDEQKALAAKNAEDTKESQQKAAADGAISRLVSGHVAQAKAAGRPVDISQITPQIMALAEGGHYKTGDMADLVANYVANLSDQSNPNYTASVTAANVNKHGPLGKDSSYSVTGQSGIRDDDAAQKVADRVAQEEGADKRNAATNKQSGANNAATIAAENARSAAALAAQNAREAAENERKAREGYKDPAVLGNLIDQALGATPAGKAPASTDTVVDPMVRAGILARASELVGTGQTRENAVLQAIKEKGSVTHGKASFFGLGSTPAPQFSPIADAAATGAAPPAAAPAPSGRQMKFNPATGKIE